MSTSSKFQRLFSVYCNVIGNAFLTVTDYRVEECDLSQEIIY
jgi:hypothetical protein